MHPSLRAAGSAFAPHRILSKGATRSLVLGEAALFLLLWWTAPLAVLPRPPEVWHALGKLWFEQGLGPELATSLLLNMEAIGITVVLSLLLSYLVVVPALRPIVIAVSKGRFLGLIGLTFLFTLVAGGGHPLKVLLLVFGMSVFFVTSMAAIVLEIPQARLDHARSLRMSEWRVIGEVVILGTADQAIEVFRQNAAIGWMMLTMVEGISRSEGGVGAMLLSQNKHFHLAEVFAIQLLILGLGLLQDFVIGLVKRLLCPYAELSLERR